MPITEYPTGTEVLPEATDLIAAFDGGGDIHVDVYRLGEYLSTVIDGAEVYVHELVRASQYDGTTVALTDGDTLTVAEWMLTDRFGSCDDIGGDEADGVVWIDGEAYLRVEPEAAIFALLPGTRTPTDQDVADAITRAKAEVLEDIASGRVPADVADFSTLHDYVDANEYGGLCDEGPIEWLPRMREASVEEVVAADRGREVQDAIHAWLQAGRPAD